MLQSRAIYAAAVAILLFCETAAAFMSPGKVLLLGGGGSRLGGCTRSGATPARVSKAATSMAAATTSKLGKALKKPTGALTIGFQVCPAAPMKERDVEELSAVLRKSKASIIFSDAASLPSFTKEQSKAKGNFPGPCPVVVWAASEEDMAASKEAGAAGVVVSVSELGVEKAAKLAESATIDVIFQVKSVSEAEEAVKAGAKVVLVSGAEDLEAVRGSIPKDVASVASVESMMPGNAEADTARALKAAGYNSIMLADACVGDAEDQPYVKWAVDALLSKQSKEFKITGMTGHVNGHYGTGTFEKSQNEVMWKRKEA